MQFELNLVRKEMSFQKKMIAHFSCRITSLMLDTLYAEFRVLWAIRLKVKHDTKFLVLEGLFGQWRVVRSSSFAVLNC